MEIKNRIITELSYLKSPGKRRFIAFSKQLNNKYGLEIGGPSSIFKVKGVFPVYVYAKEIDGVNFSTNTMWEGIIEEGNFFNYFESKIGHQYIAEATELTRIDNDKYDFLLSSHSLEHIANPLKALKEWNRVLKKNGLLVLVLPDKNTTFDYNRPYTTFTHLLDDFKINQTEQDTTHIEEIIKLHDLSRDAVNSVEALTERLSDNFTNRGAHHHVFNFELIKQALEFSNFQAIYQQHYPPFHLVTIAQKIN